MLITYTLSFNYMMVIVITLQIILIITFYYFIAHLHYISMKSIRKVNIYF